MANRRIVWQRLNAEGVRGPIADAVVRVMQDAPELYFRSPKGELLPWVHQRVTALQEERDGLDEPAQVPGHLGHLKGHSKATAALQASEYRQRAARFERQANEIVDGDRRKHQRRMRKKAQQAHKLAKRAALLADKAVRSPNARIKVDEITGDDNRPPGTWEDVTAASRRVNKKLQSLRKQIEYKQPQAIREKVNRARSIAASWKDKAEELEEYKEAMDDGSATKRRAAIDKELEATGLIISVLERMHA